MFQDSKIWQIETEVRMLQILLGLAVLVIVLGPLFSFLSRVFFDKRPTSQSHVSFLLHLSALQRAILQQLIRCVKEGDRLSATFLLRLLDPGLSRLAQIDGYREVGRSWMPDDVRWLWCPCGRSAEGYRSDLSWMLRCLPEQDLASAIWSESELSEIGEKERYRLQHALQAVYSSLRHGQPIVESAESDGEAKLPDSEILSELDALESQFPASRPLALGMLRLIRDMVLSKL